ncbi:MAG: M20 family metallopeptidase [Ignavibacteria bacterium]|nr:M20 family metallopeptidase [Ignavibacteria bacterium]
MKIDELFTEIDNIYDEIVQVRRTLHKFPELSFQEFKTTEFIQKYLGEIGLEFIRYSETGGAALVGDISNKPCIAFRADIDALPISEETNLPFASDNKGIMHACGHDLHTAILLGTAKLLKKYESELSVCVKLIFQPAEEKLPGGAKLLIEKGVLNNPNVEAVFAQHTDPETEVGKVSLAPGTIMASADELYWIVRGKSSHAAQPHLGSDPIRASVFLSNLLYELPNRMRDPIEPLLLSVTSINGGVATNIYPDEARIMGTLRTFSEVTRKKMLQSIKDVSINVGNIFNVDISFSPILGYPPVVNESELTKFVREVGLEVLGSENVLNFTPKMWAEDFAYYSQNVPSVFWFLGVKPKGYIGEFFGLHSSKFQPDENAIKFGIAMFMMIGLRFGLRE